MIQLALIRLRKSFAVVRGSADVVAVLEVDFVALLSKSFGWKGGTAVVCIFET